MKNTNPELNNYVIQIPPPHEGCGVLIGNYFITAGHVLEESENVTITFKGQKYELSKDNCISFNYMNDMSWNIQASDIAIYKLDSINSPIELYTEDVLLNDILHSISYKVFTGKINNKYFIFDSSNEAEHTEIIECNGTVVDIKGHFIACVMDYPLRKGSSGSPLFYKGKLVGILSGGNSAKEICIFQHIKSIMQLLPK